MSANVEKVALALSCRIGAKVAQGGRLMCSLPPGLSAQQRCSSRVRAPPQQCDMLDLAVCSNLTVPAQACASRLSHEIP